MKQKLSAIIHGPNLTQNHKERSKLLQSLSKDTFDIVLQNILSRLCIGLGSTVDLNKPMTSHHQTSFIKKVHILLTEKTDLDILEEFFTCPPTPAHTSLVAVITYEVLIPSLLKLAADQSKITPDPSFKSFTKTELLQNGKLRCIVGRAVANVQKALQKSLWTSINNKSCERKRQHIMLSILLHFHAQPNGISLYPKSLQVLQQTNKYGGLTNVSDSLLALFCTIEEKHSIQVTKSRISSTIVEDNKQSVLCDAEIINECIFSLQKFIPTFSAQVKIVPFVASAFR